MSYIIAYTLKHNEIPDTFVDRWMVYRDDEGMSEEEIKQAYDTLIETDGGEEDYHLFTIAMAKVIHSTDY